MTQMTYMLSYHGKGMAYPFKSSIPLKCGGWYRIATNSKVIPCRMKVEGYGTPNINYGDIDLIVSAAAALPVE